MRISFPEVDPLLSSLMQQASLKCEMLWLELKSSQTILAINHCQGTKSKKFKRSRSSLKKLAHCTFILSIHVKPHHRAFGRGSLRWIRTIHWSDSERGANGSPWWCVHGMSFNSCVEIPLVRSFLFPPEPFSEKNWEEGTPPPRAHLRLFWGGGGKSQNKNFDKHIRTI